MLKSTQWPYAVTAKW